MPSKVSCSTPPTSVRRNLNPSPRTKAKEEVCLAEVSAHQRQYAKKSVPVSSDIHVKCPKFEIVLEGGVDISVLKAVIAEVARVC